MVKQKVDAKLTIIILNWNSLWTFIKRLILYEQIESFGNLKEHKAIQLQR